MHEMGHLHLFIEARTVDGNKLFTSNQEQKAQFIRNLEPSLVRYHKMGLSENAIAEFCSALFDGLNRQILNTPLDLFIEQRLYSTFPDLRPSQFLSLFALNHEGLKAVTDKKVVDLAPKSIIAKSKVYNIVNALQFKELYGVNLLDDFQAASIELRRANTFYEQYSQIKNTRNPGQEYDLVFQWAKELEIDQYFALVLESEYRKQKKASDLTSEKNDLPAFEHADEASVQRKNEQFLKEQAEIGTNMAVVMFMVDALKYFKDMPQENIKKIAFDIASKGTSGINPQEKAYTIHSIPGKSFSGYHLLAFYYVSWALAMPEMLEKLQLPYNNEYSTAVTLFEMKK
jgi:hypothetical protein